MLLSITNMIFALRELTSGCSRKQTMTKYLITNWDRLCEGKGDMRPEEGGVGKTEECGGLDTFFEGGLFKMNSKK